MKQRLSRWDRYLGMTAPMTQVPVPTATLHKTTIQYQTAQKKSIFSAIILVDSK